MLSWVQFLATPWTVAHQALLHGIFQARIMGWVAISFSRGSSQPRDGTCLLCLLHWQMDSIFFNFYFNHWATWEASNSTYMNYFLSFPQPLLPCEGLQKPYYRDPGWPFASGWGWSPKHSDPSEQAHPVDSHASKGLAPSWAENDTLLPFSWGKGLPSEEFWRHHSYDERAGPQLLVGQRKKPWVNMQIWQELSSSGKQPTGQGYELMRTKTPS